MNIVFLQIINDFFCVDFEYEFGFFVRFECVGNDDVGFGGEVELLGDFFVILIYFGLFFQNEGVFGG